MHSLIFFVLSFVFVNIVGAQSAESDKNWSVEDIEKTSKELADDIDNFIKRSRDRCLMERSHHQPYPTVEVFKSYANHVRCRVGKLRREAGLPDMAGLQQPKTMLTCDTTPLHAHLNKALYYHREVAQCARGAAGSLTLRESALTKALIQYTQNLGSGSQQENGVARGEGASN